MFYARRRTADATKFLTADLPRRSIDRSICPAGHRKQTAGGSKSDSFEITESLRGTLRVRDGVCNGPLAGGISFFFWGRSLTPNGDGLTAAGSSSTCAVDRELSTFKGIAGHSLRDIALLTAPRSIGRTRSLDMQRTMRVVNIVAKRADAVVARG